MQALWMEYVGSRTPDGVGQEWEHIKYYFGPENDWKCEVPVALAGVLIQDFGIDKFLPCFAPSMGNIKELQDKIIVLEKENKALKIKSEKLEEELERIELPLKSSKPSKRKK